MNQTITYTPLKYSRVALWTFFMYIVLISSVKGQSNTSGYNDVARQRLLIRITAHYIHTISQGQIDMDSAVRIPCKLYGLSPFLVYNEGYSNGKPTIGTRLLDAGKVNEVKRLLGRVQGEARMLLLVELGSFFVFKPGAEKADLNEASKYTNEVLNLCKTQSVKWKIEGMTLQAHLLQQSGLENESQKIFADIVKQCQQFGKTQAAARTLLSAGNLLPYGHPLRLSKFEKALAIFQSQQAKEKEIETLSDINVENFVSKRYRMAEQLTREIIKLQTQINFHHQQYAYDVLAYLGIHNENLTSALSYSNKSLESVTSRADSVFAAFFYTRQAQLYGILNKNDEAMTWLDKALAGKSTETRLYWYKAFLLKSRILSDLGREEDALSLLREIGTQFPPVTIFEKMYYSIAIGEANEKLKRFGIAEGHYKVFLKLAANFPDEYIHIEFPEAFSQISALYRIIGKTEKARELLSHAKPYFFKVGMGGKSNYYAFLFKIDSTEKRYLDAIKDFQLSRKFADSAFSEDQLKKADELLVKYDAEKKDKNIKLLNSQNQLERIRAAEANRTKNVTLAGLALLLVIVGLLFNRYLTKQRTNRKLEINQKELDQKNTFLETLNTEQEKLIKEKEWLIKEVHHRVKNNLQMVTSLLYSQSVYLDDAAAKLAVKDSLRRMQAMSLIHQKLYQDESTSTISMPEYINELVHYLSDSFEADNQINYEQVVEPLDLDVSQAIPLGLIITESIVNVIKYAFINGQKGTVSIKLEHDGPAYLLLEISDNGIGLPTGLDTMEHSSLGLDLMRGLTKQLKGSFKIENKNGVHITIRFTTSINNWPAPKFKENFKQDL